jgi:hypothetical protein
MTLRPNLRARFLFLPAVLLLSGCAGQQIPYESISPKLDYAGRRSVTVAVRDGRAQPATLQRDPSIVGEALVGGARKAPITIGSGAPLAKVVGEALVAALEAGGFTPGIVTSEAGESRDELVRRGLETPSDYLWVVDIGDWWTARNRRTTHTYRLTFSVLERGGQALVEQAFEGTVRWDEDGAREGGPDEPVEPRKRDQDPAPAKKTERADPDAFETAGPAATGEPAERTPSTAPNPQGEAPAPEARDPGDVVSRYLVFLLTDLLERSVNDPDVPRKMVRFP